MDFLEILLFFSAVCIYDDRKRIGCVFSRCAICQESYSHGEVMRKLQNVDCTHVFHRECIDQWVFIYIYVNCVSIYYVCVVYVHICEMCDQLQSTRNPKCPLCRRSARDLL